MANGSHNEEPSAFGIVDCDHDEAAVAFGEKRAEVRSLLFDMARWMQQAEHAACDVEGVARMNEEEYTQHELWLSEGRRLREQADRLVGFPRGVR